MVAGMSGKEGMRLGEMTAKVPLVQGGMGVGISLSSLAGNVALHGGVGVISSAQIGFRDAMWDKDPIETNLRVLKEEIKKRRKLLRVVSLGLISWWHPDFMRNM